MSIVSAFDSSFNLIFVEYCSKELLPKVNNVYHVLVNKLCPLMKPILRYIGANRWLICKWR